MRLTTAEHQAIRQAITEVDPEATIYLFGSRANDKARGGDIDLLVISRKICLMDKLTVLARLHQVLGEQKIDLAVYPDLSRPFARLARESGVPL
jgi:predicted nucleotidyltransferase